MSSLYRGSALVRSIRNSAMSSVRVSSKFRCSTAFAMSGFGQIIYGPLANKRALRSSFFEIYVFVFFKSTKSWAIKNGVRMYDFAFVFIIRAF